MNDKNNLDKKVFAFTKLSKEELVAKLLNTPRFDFNGDGMSELILEFFKDCGVVILSEKEYHSKRKIKAKKGQVKHPSNDFGLIDGAKVGEQYDASWCTLDADKLKLPKETQVYGKWNEFILQEIKNALLIWLEAKNKDAIVVSWAKEQSEKMYGQALKKCGVGKWRTKKGHRYLLVVPGHLREIFYSHRSILK